MRTWLLTLAVLGAAACSTHPHEHSQAHAPAAATIPLNLKYGAPLLRLSIAGGDEADAIFDTGSQGAVVNIDYARAHALANEGLDYVVSPLGGDRIEGFRTTIRNARLSGVSIPAFSAVAVPLDLGAPVAVLSPDAFPGQIVTLDFAAAELRIAPRNVASPPQGVESGYDASSLPTIALNVAGRILHAHLDTGADHAISMPLALAADIPLHAPPRLSGRLESIGAQLDVYTARVRGKVVVGPLTLRDPEIEFVDSPTPQFNIGMNLIRRMIVALDPERKRVWTQARLANNTAMDANT